MSTVSARDEETALHLLNTVVPPVDRRDPVTGEGEVPGLLRSWLHQEALVSALLVSAFRRFIPGVLVWFLTGLFDV